MQRMNDITFRKHFSRLERAYPWTKIEKETLRIYYEKLSVYTEEVLQETVEALIGMYDVLPAVSKCLAVADSVQFNRNQAAEMQARREKEAEAKACSLTGNKAKQCFELISKYTDGRLTRRQYLEKCQSLGHNMAPLKAELEREGYDLDDYPLQGVIAIRNRKRQERKEGKKSP